MAVENAVVRETVVETPPPIFSVQSRVSWGALLGGATVALAIYSLLTMLGLAIGFTVMDRMDEGNVGMGAGIWAFVSLLIALFFGGWVATVCTSGENRTEAVLYGVIVWGITSSLLVWLTAAGLSMGMGTVLAERGLPIDESTMSIRTPAIDDARGEGEQNSDRRDRGEERNANANRNAGNREALRNAAWWSFGGTLLSLAAAIGGALLGPYELVSRREYRSRHVMVHTAP